MNSSTSSPSASAPFSAHLFNGPACPLHVRHYGNAKAPAVLMNSSILASSQMWHAQASLLAACGFQVFCLDTRGHGDSHATEGAYHMNDLIADSVSVLDHFGIEQAHYVGLSLGGMSGFGLAQQHPERLLSLLLCDCRADMPPPLGAPWDERVALAQEKGCLALAQPTLERWFGEAFLAANPEITERFTADIARTQVAGFVGCARSIQTLDFLPGVGSTQLPITLLVGANDGPLPGLMASLKEAIPGAKYELIANAGHLPNIDQPLQFNAAMMRHFFQNPAWSHA
jgi:3-oxoadipate enol-lactonase